MCEICVTERGDACAKERGPGGHHVHDQSTCMLAKSIIARALAAAVAVMAGACALPLKSSEDQPAEALAPDSAKVLTWPLGRASAS